MGFKVVKFGGSSLADANQFKKVAAIIKSDDKRKFVDAQKLASRFRASRGRRHGAFVEQERGFAVCDHRKDKPFRHSERGRKVRGQRLRLG